MLKSCIRKILPAVFCALVFVQNTGAQDVDFHFGLTAGPTFSCIPGVETTGDVGAHAGFSFLLKLPYFFAVQPQLRYDFTCATLQGTQSRLKNDVLSIPVSVQWGPDLGLFRPFVQCVPFVNFNLNNEQYTSQDGWSSTAAAVNVCQAGIGLGGGLDIWRIQIAARYNWLFSRYREGAGLVDEFCGRSHNTVTLSVSYFFK